MARISVNIINTCIWCEKEMPYQLNKMLCSMKCLRETIKACEKQNGKGTCGYDKSDVIRKPKLYKRISIKKQTEAKRVKREGKY